MMLRAGKAQSRLVFLCTWAAWSFTTIIRGSFMVTHKRLSFFIC